MVSFVVIQEFDQYESFDIVCVIRLFIVITGMSEVLF